MKLFISDCDGVLVDSEILAAQMMLKYLQQYNLNFVLEDYLRKWSGVTFTGILTALSKEYNITFSENCVEEVVQLHEHYVTGLKPINGVKEAYSKIDLPKAVVSNSYKWQVENSVAFVGMQEVFGERIFAAEMVERPKPYPDIYLYAAKKLGVRPQEVIVIEDSKSGATAAVEAGMQVIGFTGASHILEDHEDKLYEIGVKKVVQQMEDLPQVVEEIIQTNGS